MSITYKTTTLTIILLIISYLYSPFIFSQSNDTDNDPMHYGRLLFFKCTQDLADLDDCYSYFKNLLTSDEVHQGLVKTYLAMVIAIESRNTILPWKKLQLAKRSIARLNQQVKRYPNHFEIRLLRLTLLQNVPFFLKTDLDLEMEKEYLKSQLIIEEKNLHDSLNQMTLNTLSYD